MRSHRPLNPPNPADNLKDSIYNNKDLLAKINECLKTVFGEDNAKKIGELTATNSPTVSGELTSEGIKAKFNMPYPPPYAVGVGNVGGQFGTIYIGSQWLNNPAEPLARLQNGYVHELGNLISYRLANGNYSAFGKSRPPDHPKDQWWDKDSGYQFQLCVYGK